MESTIGSPRAPAPRFSSTAFTLVEVVVALAIVLILAAVAVPTLGGYLDEKRVEASADQLAAIRDALYDNSKTTLAVRQKVGSNAGRLSELDSVIIANNAAYSHDSCGGAFQEVKGNTEVTNWIANGPFTTYNSEHNTGMSFPIGQANDVLTRNPPTGGAGTLKITFNSNVSLNDADLLDKYIDGGNGWNTGIVRWTPQLGTNGIVTLEYYITIDAAC